jgi:hypothetical protein
MSILTKITTIIIRFQALIFLAMALIEWGMIAVGILLSSFKLISTNSIALEARLLQSVFYLLVSAVLFFRGKAIANYLTDDLQGNESFAQNVGDA